MVWVALPELIEVCLYHRACGSTGIKSLTGTVGLSLQWELLPVML